MADVTRPGLYIVQLVPACVAIGAVTNTNDNIANLSIKFFIILLLVCSTCFVRIRIDWPIQKILYHVIADQVARPTTSGIEQMDEHHILGSDYLGVCLRPPQATIALFVWVLSLRRRLRRQTY